MREIRLDPITDIFRTMHVTAFGLHRLEATAPWGVKQENQAKEKNHVFRQKDFPNRFGALRHAVARQLLAECGRDCGAKFPHRW